MAKEFEMKQKISEIEKKQVELGDRPAHPHTTQMDHQQL